MAESVGPSPRFEVVAVSDVDRERARSLGADLGVPSFERHQDLLENARPDVVMIASMASSHVEIATDALRAGAHVLVEKPFALDAASAAEVARVAVEADRLLSVGFNMRFLPQAEALRAEASRPEQGRAVAARAWARSPGIPWWGPHYQREVSGGGALASTAVHLLDLALWVCDFPEPVAAVARTATLYPRRRGTSAPEHAPPDLFTSEDLMAGFISFADGFWLALDGSWVADTATDDYSAVVLTEHGELRLEPLRTTLDNGQDFTVTREDPPLGLDLRGAVRASVRDFLDCVDGDRAPRVTMRQAVMVQAITDALYASARQGREVEITDCWSEFKGRDGS